MNLFYPVRGRTGGLFLPSWRKFPEAVREFSIRMVPLPPPSPELIDIVVNPEEREAGPESQIDPDVDSVTALSISAAPSGAGELELISVTLVGDTIVFTAGGGQPRRDYTIKALATMSNGRVYEFVGEMTIVPVLESDQPAGAPSTGFGPEVTWGGAGVFDFSNPDNSALLLLL